MKSPKKHGETEIKGGKAGLQGNQNATKERNEFWTTLIYKGREKKVGKEDTAGLLCKEKEKRKKPYYTHGWGFMKQKVEKKVDTRGEGRKGKRSPGERK